MVLLSRFVGTAPSIIEMERLGNIDLENYSHIILAHGNFNRLDDATKVAIKSWVRKGGVIWGHKGGAKFLADQQLLKANYLSRRDVASAFDTTGLTYADKDDLQAVSVLQGLFLTQWIYSTLFTES